MFWAKQSKVCLPSISASPRFLSSCDVEMAVGVQAAVDLVLEVSLVTAQQSPPSARPSDRHPWLVQGCPPLPPSPASQLQFGSCPQVGLRSRALVLASTICTLINLFNLPCINLRA